MSRVRFPFQFTPYIMVVLFHLLYIPSLMAQHLPSYQTLWANYQSAVQKGYPQQAEKALLEIQNKASTESNGADYLQAIALLEEVQESSLEAKSALYRRLTEAEKNERFEPCDRLFASFLKLLLLDEVAYTILPKETGGPLIEHKRLPDEIALWSISDWVGESSMALSRLCEGLLHFQGKKSTCYRHILEKGDASKQLSHSLGFAVLSDLSSLFEAPYSSFYQATYSLHPAYSVFTATDVQLPCEEFTALLRDVEQPHHLPAQFLHLLSVAESSSSTATLRLLYQRMRGEWIKGDIDAQIRFLDTLAKQYHPVLGYAEPVLQLYADKAELLAQSGKKKEALAICNRYIRSSKSSAAIAQLRMLRDRILTPLARVWIGQHSLWSGSTLQGEITFRNLEGITLKVYDISPYYRRLYEAKRWQTIEDLGYLLRQQGLKAVPTAERKLACRQYFPLKSKEPYEEHRHAFELRPLPIGAYCVVAEAKGLTFYPTLLLISDLQPIILGDEQSKGLLVLEKKAGRPRSKAFIATFDWRYKSTAFSSTSETDENGLLMLPQEGNAQKQLYLEDKATRDCYAPRVSYYARTLNRTPQAGQSRVVLFSDRAIYRPSQKIFFKGVAYRTTYEEKQSEKQLQCEASFQLRLVSSQTGETIDLGQYTTNSKGSFAGSFSLPREMLSGNYEILVSELYAPSKVRSIGSSRIRIEEYKRPTFEVAFDSDVSSNFLYGEKLLVHPKVQYLMGAPLMNAQVSYRLEAKLFRWGCWWLDPIEFPLQEGKVTTDIRGKALLPNLPLQLSAEQEKRVKAELGKAPSELFIRYSLTVVATSPEGETEENSLLFYTGKRNPSLEATIATEQPKEKLSQWQVVARDFVEENIPNLSGSYAIYAYQAKGNVGTPLIKGTFVTGQPLSAQAIASLPSGKYTLHLAVENKEFSAENDFVFQLFSLSEPTCSVDSVLFAYQPSESFSDESPLQVLVASAQRSQDIYMLLDGDEKRFLSSGKPLLTSQGKPVDYQTIAPFLLRFSLSQEQQLFTLQLPSEVSVLRYRVFTLREGQLYEKQFEAHREPKAEIRKNLVVEGLQESYRPGEEVALRIGLRDSLNRYYPAELALWMYDAALDKLLPYRMPAFESSYATRLPYLIFSPQLPNSFYQWGDPIHEPSYRPSPSTSYDTYQRLKRFPLGISLDYARVGSVANVMATQEEAKMAEDAATPAPLEKQKEATEESPQETHFRQDFRETAVWLPQIALDSTGFAEVQFSLPESLTAYSLKLFAHNSQVGAYQLEREVKVDQELLLMLNIPRYIRQGDCATIGVNVLNRTGQAYSEGLLSVKVFEGEKQKELYFEQKPLAMDANATKAMSFDLPRWDRMGWITVQIVAQAGHLQDATEYRIPILPIRKPMVEAVPLSLYSGGLQQVDLSQLFNEQSLQAHHKSLTLTINANPLWATMASLPTVIACSDQDAVSLAMALYGQTASLALLQNNPSFKNLLTKRQQQKEDSSPTSRMLENNELRILSTELGAYYGIALKENTTLDDLGLLLDDATQMQTCKERIKALLRLQNSDGGFAWMPGMRSNLHTTFSVIEVLSLLPEGKTKETLQEALIQATRYAYKEILRGYELLPTAERTRYMPPYAYELLRCLSIYAPEYIQQPDTMTKQMLATLRNDIPRMEVYNLAQIIPPFVRMGDTKTASRAFKRLKEYIRWEEGEGYRVVAGSRVGAPTTLSQMLLQIRTLEALRCFQKNEEIQEGIKLYLLNLRRTTDWGNPLVTALALQAFFGEEETLTDYDGKATIVLDRGDRVEAPTLAADSTIVPTAKKSVPLMDDEPFPQSATATKEGKGVAWGALYATYDLPMSQLVEQGSKDLKLSREVFLWKRNETGEMRKVPLVKGEESIQVGDRLTVVLTLEATKNFEFIILNDKKIACGEWIASLSGYQYSYPLGYYSELKDSEARFYIDYLPRGAYQFSYDLVVDRKGEYFGGMAEVQAVYAPEYVAHTAGEQVLRVE